MTSNNSLTDLNNNEKNTFHDSEMPIPREIRFWLLLAFSIPSTICSFFLLFHLIIDKNLRKNLVNHPMIILLVIGIMIELVNIPFHLNFLRFGTVQPSIPFICLLWWFTDLGLYNGFTIIMAWSAIHRYLFIFHDHVLTLRKNQFFFHYLPLIILAFYIFIFYTIILLSPPCKHIFNYELPVCNDCPCYLNDVFWGLWDSIVNSVLPTIIISVASVGLIIHVNYKKQRVHQNNRLHRQRKMITQLLFSSFLCLIPNVPSSILVMIHLCGVPESVGVVAQLYFDFLCYFVIFLYPFVCLASLSELRKKIKWCKLFALKWPHRASTVTPQ